MNYIVIRVHQKNKNIVNEELSLRGYAESNGIKIGAIFYDESGQKEELGVRKRFLEFLNNIKKGDKLVVSSLDTLGWRVGELVQIIAKIFDKNGEIVCVADNETLHPKMEAKALILKLSNVRAQNIQNGISKLGRPKGSRSKSKYDAYLPQIVEFLKESRNISALARKLNISRTSLKDYITSRGL